MIGMQAAGQGQESKLVDEVDDEIEGFSQLEFIQKGDDVHIAVVTSVRQNKVSTLPDHTSAPALIDVSCKDSCLSCNNSTKKLQHTPHQTYYPSRFLVSSLEASKLLVCCELSDSFLIRQATKSCLPAAPLSLQQASSQTAKW